jgi:hypothetical protein
LLRGRNAANLPSKIDPLDIVDDVNVGRCICPFDKSSDILRSKRKQENKDPTEPEEG